MRTVGLFEAKQKLSELVERATEGEQIGITRRGRLSAFLVPARPGVSVKAIFEGIEQVRKRAKRPRNFKLKSLIEEGRV